MLLTLAPAIMMVFSGLPAMEVAEFVLAKPVWLEGRETEMNVFAGFRTTFPNPGASVVQVRVTASTLYRLFVNGRFVGHGPARGPHGHYRVDAWDIASCLTPGENVVALEVAGYNANSYYVLDQPSFLQAEVVADDKVLAATGLEAPAFAGFPITERIQKVQRYSFQRPFIEVYALQPGYDAWRVDTGVAVPEAKLALTEPVRLLSRGVPYPHSDIHPAEAHVSTGVFEAGRVKQAFRDRSLMNISDTLKGYPMDELDIVVSDLLSGLHTTAVDPVNAPLGSGVSIALDAGQFQVLDLGTNLSGFVRIQVACPEPVRLVITFDETATDLDVNWRRLGCVNALLYDLAPGQYTLEAFEPHTMRFIKLMALSGRCSVSDVGLRLYEHPGASRALFACADENLNRIFEAARTTFAQNSVDIFMDCPHRERAGWLCDSYFTARSALSLTGKVDVEHNFIENYLLPERFAHLPEGMLPMCYPADHYDGVFIPNWALWFVIQLREYALRGGDEAIIAGLKPRLESLFAYFKKFENEQGLLEKLESWVFVEWSAANNFVQDVNYPSNMLYAAALETGASLYGVPEWRDKAEAIRKAIREEAMNGVFFVDNAKFEGGALQATQNMSEVCQYFAFYFGPASPETDPELWRILMDEFGPRRQEQGLYPEVHPANAFIGNMLRFELLSRAGRAGQILHEMEDYLMYMVERTGTLWENQQDHASLNHGFASHAAVTLYRDILGAYEVDILQKRLHIRLNPITLAWCGGKLPVGDAFITIQWKQDESNLALFVDTPEGFSVHVDNHSGKSLDRAEAPVLDDLEMLQGQ